MSTNKGKLIIIHNTVWYLERHYKELIDELEKLFVVCILAPHDKSVEYFQNKGIECLDIPLSRRGLNIFREIKVFQVFYSVFKNTHPDMVFNFSIKPNIYASIIAHFMRIKVICSMVTGLGYIFVNKDLKARLIQWLLYWPYQYAMKSNSMVFFQNGEDRNYLLNKGIASINNTCVINGTGINLDEYTFCDNQVSVMNRFILVGRLLRDKGIIEYVMAAKMIKKKYSHVTFQILGGLDDNPSSIKKTELDAWITSGFIEYLGEVQDVRPYLQNSAVFVLPSYREGLSRSILEAMAMGKPIVATDVPGCRQLVEEGVNGYLVPAKDPDSLAEAMEKFVDNAELISSMGCESRRIVEEDYNVQDINKAVVSRIEKLAGMA
ncbi:MAG TPA: glycosyltransferase family 1 protein [Gammaproteobacteria bacterium]|nr:glycosyltransferase family 1 protein [Gammaproteobacteria bacterium]